MTDLKSSHLRPTRSRTPSPVLFENNLSDFENSDSDQEGDVITKDRDVTNIADHDTFDTHTLKFVISADNAEDLNGFKIGISLGTPKNIGKPNFTSKQPSRDSEDLGDVKLTRATSDDEDTKAIETSIKGKRTNSNNITNKDTLTGSSRYAKEIGRKEFSDKDNNASERYTKRKKHASSDNETLFPPNETGIDYDTWNESWSLTEDDLVERNTNADPTIRIDPSLTESAREPESLHRNIRWPKFQKLPRAYHYRPARLLKNGGRTSKAYKMMSKSSPFAILSSFAARYKISLEDLLKKYDETTFNEQFPVRFPCMQCYEKQGTKGYGYESYYSGTTDPYYDDYGPYDSTDLGTCKKCGGKVQTMATFIKMVVGLKTKLETNNLVVHDVYPDGNCLFAAVVDQLRIRGVFAYTIQNLRQASVDYLRDNPISSDGETHFELFLSDETWEDYLTRMSQDGEWGDHMVLSAIANITHQRIVIFGGRSGEGLTIILPTDLQEPLPAEDPSKKTVDEGDEAEDSKPVDQEGDGQPNNKENNIGDVAVKNVKESKIVKEGLKQDSIDDPQGEKNAGLEKKNPSDTEKAKDTGKEAKTEAEEENWRDFDKTETIFLGHFGESHYVSLRQKDWEEKLFPSAGGDKHNKGDQETKEPDDETLHYTTVPQEHLNYFLKLFFKLEYLHSLHSDRIDFVHMQSESEFAKEEGVGKIVNKLAPCFDQVKIYGPDIGTYMPVEKETDEAPDHLDDVLDEEIRTMLLIPKDTTVVFDSNEAKKFDLLAEQIEGYPDLLMLSPVRPDKWKGVMVDIEGKQYLEAIEPKDEMLLAFQMRWPNAAKTWMHRRRSCNWPDTKIMQKVSDEGCHAVPVTLANKFEAFTEDLTLLSEEDNSNPALWMISFAIPEKVISGSLTTAQLNTYYIFEALVVQSLKDNNFPILACKHIFFHACENIDRSTWENAPGTCLLQLLKRMSNCLEKGVLPHYFIPEINVFRQTPNLILEICFEKIEFIRKHIVVFIHFLLYKHKITNSEAGFFLDELIEDITMFEVHQDMKRSIRECLVPASCSLVSSLIYQNEYDFAFRTILCIKEELRNAGIQGVSTIDIVTKGLSGEHLGYQWCMALYYDIKKGTTITKKVTGGLPTVHITEVFGPEILASLPDTLVPKQYASAVLNFPVEVAKVLKHAGLTRAIATGIRYYLETFFDNTFGSGSYSEVTMSPTYAVLLHDLMVTLYYSYKELGQKEEFRDLLPRFMKISQYGGRSIEYSVEDICKDLGEEETLKQYKSKAPTMFKMYLAT